MIPCLHEGSNPSGSTNSSPAHRAGLFLCVVRTREGRLMYLFHNSMELFTFENLNFQNGIVMICIKSNLLVVLGIFLCFIGDAQPPPSTVPTNLLPPFYCGNEENMQDEPKSTPCTPSSATWLNDYRT